MFDRRSVLLGGAALAAGCATPATATPDPAADAAFRDFVERLGQRSRSSRAFLLRRFDVSRLTHEGRTLYEALLPGADADAALARFPYGEDAFPYAVTHRNGLFRRAMELRREDNHRAGARAIVRGTSRLERDAARGVIPPAAVIDATLPDLERAVQRVSASADPAHAELAEALARQRDALQALRPGSPDELGVWRLPGGERYYALTLQFYLGQAIDPRQAHNDALARARALHAEADALMRRQGLARGTVAARFRDLAQQQLTPRDAAGKATIVSGLAERLERVRALIAPAFEAVPPAELRLLPASEEANGTQGRRQGSSYLLDLGAPRPRWTLPSVLHHELVPGHLLQAPFERAAAPLPLQLRYSSGYSEGWAVYAEHLADSLGAFEGDPLGRLGYLQWMLFRLARIVADTGIHVLRWDRVRAAEEMRALQGDSIAFVSIEDDIVRMAAQPALAGAQGLAALHLIDLREAVVNRRDPASLPRFHTAMLQRGPLAPPGLDAATRVNAAL